MSANVTIDAPPATVFAIVADPHQHPRIDGSGSVRGIVEGPQRLTRGATFAMRMRLFGFPYRITNRVVEYEPDRLIAWRHFGAHRWRYELEAPARGWHSGHGDVRLLPVPPLGARPAVAAFPGAEPSRHRADSPAPQGRRRGRFQDVG